MAAELPRREGVALTAMAEEPYGFSCARRISGDLNERPTVLHLRTASLRIPKAEADVNAAVTVHRLRVL